jgi:NAD-dependent dihydropyrimidine dehydrogenase PreA subunit
MIDKERRRLGWLLAALPFLVCLGAWGGAKLSPLASRLHPTVSLADRYVNQGQNPVAYGALTPEALSLERAEANPDVVLADAARLHHRFDLAAMLFGGWAGLVIGVKLIALSPRQKRTDYEPDRGACFACARCFNDCPNERARLGLPAATELPALPAMEGIGK